jgi:class 3 adenylate cyclase/tetratricopeptide (TPR) repeat protein
VNCSSCGVALAEGARFCSQCGTPVVAVAASERRKTVTVVFTDLVESTSMAERLDPEALSTILGRYFALARSIAERHGGTVEKFIGDAVVAMFGVRQVREDDALRAVRTAVELRDAVGRLNDELDAAFGVRLRLRTGINTGEVLVDQAQTDSLAVGHPVSMAARLEQGAGPDEVVIGEPTFRLVGTAVDARPIEPLAVKGSSVPLLAWRVDGLAATPARGWAAGGTYLGRDEELTGIVAAFRRSVADGRAAACLVVAPPGIGKTRFAAEAVARFDPAPRVAIGRGVADGGSAYGPLVEVLRQLGAGDDGGRFESELDALPDGPRVARAAAALVDDSGAATTAEVAWVGRRMATALAARQPLVIVLDDLHWADPLLLDVVAELVDPPLAAPVFVLGTGRPELAVDRAGWLASMPSLKVIRLQPLGPEDTARLVTERLAADASDAQRQRIVEAASGVPLFVEQLAALDAESVGQEIPSTIRALMAARIDRITGDGRAIVETAAIAGERFSLDDVAGATTADPSEALDALVRREILRRDGDTEATYRFSHALLRDAAIDALPRRRRAELHERRAAALEAFGTPDLDRVGFHLEAAWRELTSVGLPDAHSGAIAQRASQALATAGRRSLARKEWHRAAGLLGRAKDLVADDPAAVLAVLPDLLDALVFTRAIDDAAAVRAEGLALAADDPAARYRIEVAWARLLSVTGPVDAPDRMVAVADEAIGVFEAAGDGVWLGRAWMLRAMGLEDVDASIDALQRTRVMAERSGDERTLIEVWDELGGTMIGARTPWPEVLEFMRAEVAWARARGVAFTEADGTLGSAYALAALGDTDEALAAIAAAQALFDTLPSVVGQAGEAHLLRARIHHDDGAPQAALDERALAIETFEAAGEPRWATSARIAHAHSLIDVVRIGEAAAVLDGMAGDPELAGVRHGAVLLGQARVALAEDRRDDALRLAADASVLLDPRPWSGVLLVRAHEELGRLYEALDRPDDARACYETMLLAATIKDDRVARRRHDDHVARTGR